MGKNVVRGKFAYDEKKNKKKKNKKKNNIEKTKKVFLKEDKKLRKRCECNHIDCKHNKMHLKTVEIGEPGATVKYKKCKICGGMMINDSTLMNESTIKTSVEVLYSLFSIIRTRFNISPSIDKAISTTLFMNERALTLAGKLTAADMKNKKNKKKKNKKKNKKNKHRYSRINY